MAIMSSRLIRHEVCKEALEEAGAKVIDVQGIMFHVSFKLKEHEIAYIYHLNPDNSFLLERVKPYFVQIGTYNKEENIVNAIKIDIEQFRNAMRSSNFEDFIKVDDHLSKLVRVFEDLYLYYNVNKDQIDELDTILHDVLDRIRKMTKECDRIYYKKDPDVLNTNLKFDD